MLGRPGPRPDGLARGTLSAVLVAAPLALGGNPPWALAGLELLVLCAMLCWALSMLRNGVAEWRRTSLDLPLCLLVGLVLVQLALGNGPLRNWALAADSGSAASLPSPFLALGTIAPRVTRDALLQLLAGAAVYYLVVNTMRRRRHLDAFVRVLLVAGSLVAVVSLVDAFAPELRLFSWRYSAHRAAGPFANADHLGAWLNMLVFLGLGYLFARGPRGAPSWRAALRSPEGLGQLAGRYSPLAAVAVMSLALVFTLSRGALVSFLAALVVALALGAATGLARRTLALIGVLLAVTLAYSVWFGLGPLLGRLSVQAFAGRPTIWLSSLPMIRDFPLLGTGLGTYAQISPRYQPPSLNPGEILVNQAHNDWLQILVELGPIGAVIVLYGLARVGRDLVGAHLLGRSRCQVGGGEAEWARRNDPFSVGLALGAIAAVASVLAHSVVDYPARVPADGFLVAACLGIATVALHTRFGHEDGFLASRWSWSVPTRPRARWAVRTLITAGITLIALAVVRPALADAILKFGWHRAGADLAGFVDGGHPAMLRTRADANLARAIEVWSVGADVSGQAVRPQVERRGEALTLTKRAISDLDNALASLPSQAPLHDRLAWAYRTLAVMEPAAAPGHVARAVSHLQRAIALAPEDPFFHHSLARLAAAAYPHVPPEIGLRAARESVARKPDVLPELVYEFLIMPLTGAQWAALVPDTPADRLVLGDLLEQRGLLREATGVYRQAAETPKPEDASLARWLVARTLMRQQDLRGALLELGAAAKLDPDNPELFLTTADALNATQDPAALELYRFAVATVESRIIRKMAGDTPFRLRQGRLQQVVSRHLAPDVVGPTARYRRALARHLAERELWQQALRESQSVLQEAPGDALTHFVRATALEAVGQTDDAINAYEKAVSLESHNVQFRRRLAEALWRSKQPHQAINHWAAVLGIEPGNLDAALALARAYAANSASQDAYRAYKHVLDIAPDNVEAQRALARFGWIPR